LSKDSQGLISNQAFNQLATPANTRSAAAINSDSLALTRSVDHIDQHCGCGRNQTKLGIMSGLTPDPFIGL
jgi:hypothetical protein